MSFSASIVELVETSRSDLVGVAPWWKRVPLGSVAEVLNGFPWKSAHFNDRRGVPLIRIRDVTSGTTATRYDGPLEKGYWIENGQLLVGMDGDFNTRVWAGGKALLNQRVCRIEPFKDVYLQAFLALVLPSYLKLINGETHSITVKHLSSRTLAEIPLPLPPLAEQRRIVGQIDSLSAKSKRARDHLDHFPRLVEKYKQAILTAAFRGDLTRGWQEARSETSKWGLVSAGTIIDSIVAGKNLRCEERPPSKHEKGVLKVSAVSWGNFDPLATKTLPRSFVPPPQTRIQAGDLLISRANTLELVGAVVIVKQTPPNLFLSDKTLRLEMADETKPWLLWFLRSPAGRSAIEDSSTGNQLSMRNLSQSALRAIEVPWTGDEERREIIRYIETAFAWLDRLASDTTRARKLIDHLDRAILAKAFRGELVTHDPNDEPASVLLNRIRAQKGSAPAAKT